MREKILLVFKSVKVLLFPNPFTVGNKTEPNEDFKKKVSELREYIGTNVRESPAFHGNTILKAGNVVEITNAMVCQLNTVDTISLPSIVFALEQKEVDDAANRFKDSTREKLDKLPLPKAASEMESCLTNLKNGLTEKFNRETQNVNLETKYRDGQENTLQEFFQNESDRLKKVNNQLVTRLANASRKFRNELKKVFENIPFLDDEDNLQNELKEEADKIKNGFEQSIEDIDSSSGYKGDVIIEFQQFIRKRHKMKVDKNREWEQQISEQITRFKIQVEQSLADIELPKVTLEFDRYFDAIERDRLNLLDSISFDISLERNKRTQIAAELKSFVAAQREILIRKNDEAKGLIPMMMRGFSAAGRYAKEHPIQVISAISTVACCGSGVGAMALGAEAVAGRFAIGATVSFASGLIFDERSFVKHLRKLKK